MGIFGRKASIIEDQIVAGLLDEENQRALRFKRAWERYYGRYPKPLRTRSGQPDDNVIVNLARVIVDVGVAFLFGKNISFKLIDAPKTATEWLEGCWAGTRQMSLLLRLALNGGVCGHAFVKIVQQQPFPRLVLLDPATVSVRWEPDDIESVVSYRIQYPGMDPRTGRPVAVRQMIERDGQVWQITDQVSRDGGAWQTVAEARWPHLWPPIVDCQNLPHPNEHWGLSDLEEDVQKLNEAGNFVLSNLARIVRFHAHPKTWGKGFAAKQLDVAVDETIVLPSPDAELHNLEMLSDLSSSLAVYRTLREALHEVARIPEVATGKLEHTGQLSGLAMQILYRPLLEKTETKQRTYGDMLVELNRRLLALGGFGEDNRVTIDWPEMLPRDALQERQAALLDQQLGASTDTLLQRLGYNPDLEREKREADADAGASASARGYNQGG